MNDDNALLRQFADTRAEAAFAALVQRHLPMIYAAAFRQTGDAHRAEEVSLAAFTLLALKAGSLRDHPAIGGWLYTTTGHLAARLRRTEARRTHREQEAHAMNEASQPAGEIPGEELRPIVDEVLLALPERDRTAVLLRFFENCSHAQIGGRLGLSENAARMRVDRALDKLRDALQRRGIASTAAALGTALSAHASLAPPAGLAAGIAAGAATAASGGGLLFLMNTSLLKTGLVTAALGVTAGGWFWQHRETVRLQQEIASRPALPKERPTAPRPADDDGAAPTGDLARLSRQVSLLPGNSAASWQERAEVLQELMAQFPEFQIPELELATPEDWLDATKKPLVSDTDYRRALAQVRTAVLLRFSESLGKALRAYLQDSNGVFPPGLGELEPYFPTPPSPELLQHYKLSPASRFPNLKLGGNYVVTVKAPADAGYDTQVVLGPMGTASTPVRTLIVQSVAEAYRAANPGRKPASLADLLPYAKSNFQRDAIQLELAEK